MTPSRPTRILVIALNFPPELTGIGKYVGEMTEDLAARGAEVRVVTAPPYYPAWSVAKPYSAFRYARERLAGAEVWRCPLYVPRKPGGLKRLLHLASFGLSSLPVILWQALAWAPDVVFVVEPPLACVPAAWLASGISGGQAWLHVQDFEVDAAFDLGVLRSPILRFLGLAIESAMMCCFDRVTSISNRMTDRLATKGVDPDCIDLFPNWVDTELIRPGADTDPIRRELGIGDFTRVLLYSGNMGEKQGLELIVEAAELLRDEPDVLFLLCGEGAARARIEAQAAGLPNVRFVPFQPLDKLNALLNLATVHLLPQRAEAEDLVLPSKLTAILSSGRPVVACAGPETELARAAASGGLVVQPGDVTVFASALRQLLAESLLRDQLGASGRAYAIAHLDRRAVLGRMWSILRGTDPSSVRAAATS